MWYTIYSTLNFDLMTFVWTHNALCWLQTQCTIPVEFESVIFQNHCFFSKATLVDYKYMILPRILQQIFEVLILFFSYKNSNVIYFHWVVRCSPECEVPLFWWVNRSILKGYILIILGTVREIISLRTHYEFGGLDSHSSSLSFCSIKIVWTCVAVVHILNTDL